MGLMEKLNYLKETKSLFRNKIDPDGTKITDETPFRDYVDLIETAPPYYSGAFFDSNIMNLSRTYSNAPWVATIPGDKSQFNAIRITTEQNTLSVKTYCPGQGAPTYYCFAPYVNFPSCTKFIFDKVNSIPASSLLSASNKTIDIYNCGSMSDNIFVKSSVVSFNLIIRNSDCKISTGAFSSSDMAYIYVYEKDYNNYVAMANGAYWGSHIRKIEDYPEICG